MVPHTIISNDPASLTFCDGGIFSRRLTIVGHLIDMSADYRPLYNIWNILINGRDMWSQTWSLARQFRLLLIFPVFWPRKRLTSDDSIFFLFHKSDVCKKFCGLLQNCEVLISGFRDIGSQTWSLARQFRLYFDFSGTLTSKTTNFWRINFCYFSYVWCTQKVLWTAAKFWSSAFRVPRYGESNMVPRTTSVVCRAIPQVWPSVVGAFSAVDQRFLVVL